MVRAADERRTAVDVLAAESAQGNQGQGDQKRVPLSASLVITDRSALFITVTVLSWLGLVALPLLASIMLNTSLNGAPLLGPLLWLALQRVGRWLSPAARADGFLRRGDYATALEMCDQSLGVKGDGAWTGRRRLIWLNRRVTALLGLGRYDEALTAALEAADASPDPETIASLSVALLRLNRYDMAAEAARLASALTHERSVRANNTLAEVMLARGMPAEAEALATATLSDIQTLAPYVRRESHAASLSALCRAQQAQGLGSRAQATLGRLRRMATKPSSLVALALLEEAGVTQDALVAAELVTRARATAPTFTAWYLAQPHNLPAIRALPGVAPLAGSGAVHIAEMNATAPDDDTIRIALAAFWPGARPGPIFQSNRMALIAQTLGLAATLGLLLLWMWQFFIAQPS